MNDYQITMDNRLDIESEVWKPIELKMRPIRAVAYEVSNLGRVRVLYKHRPPHIQKLHLIHKPNGTLNRVKVKIQGIDEHMSKLVWTAFRGNVPNGMCIVHKNGLKTDNSLRNLTLMTRAQVATKYASFSCPRRVVRINRNGDVIDAYKSARAAAKELGYCCDQFIRDRCNAKVQPKHYWMQDGTSFRWEDDRSTSYLKEAMTHE